MISIKQCMIKPVILLALLALVGCDSIPFMNSAPDYKGAGRAKPLEVPPGLTTSATSDAYSVPGGSTSFNSYSQAQEGTEVGVEKILPNAEGVSLHKSGNDRWLVVNAPAEKIWPVIREFWLEMGFAVRVEQPEIGVMETEWIESDALKADEKSGHYGDKFDKWLDKLSGFADRRKFRTRLDNGADAGTTEIYMTHRTVSSAPDDGKNRIQTQLGEIDTGYRADANKAKDTSVNDNELDVELLRRLMVRLGVEANQAKQIAAAPVLEKHAKLLKDAEGSSSLLLSDAFDRGWRRVGLALDRVGFVIEDKDRSNGVFFVRYADIEVATGIKKQKGLLDKLKFWGDDKPSDSAETVASNKVEDKSNSAKQYRIKVSDVTDGSQVTVENKDGTRNRSTTANKIIGLLFEELK